MRTASTVPPLLRGFMKYVSPAITSAIGPMKAGFVQVPMTAMVMATPFRMAIASSRKDSYSDVYSGKALLLGRVAQILAMAATRGTTELGRAGVEHRVLTYAYRSGGSAGEKAAEALDVAPERMLKSLVARAGEELVFALVPVSGELSLKKLAAAAGSKSAAMATPADAERATGYQVGGISPLGSRRRLPVFVEQAAVAHPQVFVNGGGRGVIVELAAADLIALTEATAADLTVT
jgi:Cys-tRNA(Pro)/Cys-tRNA(Cys) deacylase